PTLKRDISLTAIGLLRAASTLSSSWSSSTRASVPRSKRTSSEAASSTPSRARRHSTDEESRWAALMVACDDFSADSASASGVRPAARQVGEVDAEVLSLTIERLIGRLQRRLPVDDLLQVVDPSHLLTRDGSLLRHFGLQRGGSSTLAAQLLLGLLEQLLVALQDAALLAVRLEKLIQVLAQAGLDRAGIVERQVRSPGFRRKVGRPPRRSGGGRRVLWRRCLGCGRLDRGRRFFRGLRPPGQPLRHGSVRRRAQCRVAAGGTRLPLDHLQATLAENLDGEVQI